MSEYQIGVADFIRQLRSDLETSIKEGADQKLRFEVEDLELELQVIANQVDETVDKVGGGLKLGIFSANASAQDKAALSTSQIQKVKLKLKATEDDGKGGSSRAKLKGRMRS